MTPEANVVKSLPFSKFLYCGCRQMTSSEEGSVHCRPFHYTEWGWGVKKKMSWLGFESNSSLGVAANSKGLIAHATTGVGSDIQCRKWWWPLCTKTENFSLWTSNIFAMIYSKITKCWMYHKLRGHCCDSQIYLTCCQSTYQVMCYHTHSCLHWSRCTLQGFFRWVASAVCYSIVIRCWW